MTGPSESSGTSWPELLRTGALVICVLAMVWLAFNVSLPSRESLHGIIAGFGWWAWAAFVGLYVVVAVTPIPVSIMAIVGGIMFGAIEGSLLSVVAVSIGCWGAYWIARGLGSSVIGTLLGSHGDAVRGRLEEGGFWAVSLLRLTPGIPYWPVNYGAGAFGVKQRDFLVSTLLCSIPGQVSLVAIGAFAADPSWFNGAIVVVAWIVVLTLTVVVFRRMRAERKTPAPAS